MNMTIQTHQRKLVIYDAHPEHNFCMNSAAKAGWEVIYCTTLSETKTVVIERKPDCVAMQLDALETRDSSDMQELAALKVRQRPLLLGYSDFHPDWINNFVEWAGGDVFVRGTPSVLEIIDALDHLLSHSSRYAH